MVQVFTDHPMDAPANAETFETVHCTACVSVYLVSSARKVSSTGGLAVKKEPGLDGALRCQ
jgi:hypothetical protein